MKKNKLIIILNSNDEEKINYALSISATASAIEREVELFFSGRTVNNLLTNEYLNSKKIITKFMFSNTNELLSANIDLKTTFSICSGALNENNIDTNNLRTDINWKITGLTEILASKDSQIIFI